MIALAVAACLLFPSAEVDSIARQAMKEFPSVGMQVAVAQKGRIVFERGYGFSDLENRLPVTAETVFHADSITKHFVATMVLKLASEGKLSLNEDIGMYVPQMKGRNIKLRQLLTHTSGLGNYNDLPEFVVRERQDWSHEEVVGLIQKSPQIFTPGTSWSYSNSAFFLLGIVVEKASGLSFANVLKRLITEPGALKSTSLGLNQPIIAHRSRGYAFVKGQPVNAADISWSGAFSGGAICSTAGDLVRFESELDSGLILNSEAVAAMRSPQILPKEVKVDYGFGTRLGDFFGHSVVGHTGSGGGFNNILLFFPPKKLAIAVMTNADSSEPSRYVCSRIAAMLLGIRYANPKPVALDPLFSKLKFGTYRTEDGAVSVYVEDGKFKYRAGQSQPVLIPYFGNLRAGAGPEGYATVVARDGVAAWVMLYRCGLFSEAAPRVGP